MEYTLSGLSEVHLQRNRAFRGPRGTEYTDWIAVRKWERKEGETSKHPQGSKNRRMFHRML